MKKQTYSQPTIQSISVETEGMMALSLNINESGGDNSIDNPEDAWSQHKGGWNSEDWSE